MTAEAEKLPGLKPCPWCGEAGVPREDGDGVTYWVDCDTPDCPTSMPSIFECGTEAEAIAAWNERPVNTADAADMEHFRARLAQMRSHQEASHDRRVALIDELPGLLRARTYSTAAYWATLAGAAVTTALALPSHWLEWCVLVVAVGAWGERASKRVKENRRRMDLLNAWSDGMQWLAPPDADQGEGDGT